MKRDGNLFDRIANFTNLFEAARLVRRGKRYTAAGLAFDFDGEAELLRLEREIKEGRLCRGGNWNNTGINSRATSRAGNTSRLVAWYNGGRVAVVCRFPKTPLNPGGGQA